MSGRDGIYDLLVIGAGPAGLMAAITAAREGVSVAVLERHQPAAKLKITGKGRCNLTNALPPDVFLGQLFSGSRFLTGALYSFPPAQVMAFFEGLGVPLKTERGGRVFPISDRASDIADALLAAAAAAGVRIIPGRASSILVADGCVAGVQLEAGEMIRAGKVLIATGGKSYPRTGSTGDGYQLAVALGHTVVPPRPALIPVETKEGWCRDCQGLSLRNVTLSLWEAGRPKPLYRGLGEMLFTHFGVSGPLVLTASSYMRADPVSRYRLTIDLKPGLTPAQLEQRLLRDFGKQQNKQFSNSLDELLPRTLIPAVVALSGIAPEIKVNQISREQRRALLALIKELPLQPAARRPIDEAIVTAGGVDLNEVNPKTMESRRVPGLYFAGEVLDIDGPTGGFNLQLAFSTGRAAGLAAAQNIAKE